MVDSFYPSNGSALIFIVLEGNLNQREETIPLQGNGSDLQFHQLSMAPQALYSWKFWKKTEQFTSKHQIEPKLLKKKKLLMPGLKTLRNISLAITE